MATYSGGSWKATNLTFNGRHSGNNPWQANEFVDAFPPKKTDYDVNYGSITRNKRQQISVKVKDGKAVEFKDYCKDGSKWKCYTLDADKFYKRNGSKFGGFGLGDFADDRDFKWKDSIKNKAIAVANSLNSNYEQNERDLAVRQKNNEMNVENTKYNNTLGPKRQAEADKFNAKGDKEVQRVDAINNWSNAAVNWAKSSPTGQYVNNRAKIDSNSPGGQAEYLTSLVNNGVITNDTKNSLLSNLKTSYKSYYGSTRVTPWDYEAQGINPPVGGFDSAYYLKENQGGQNLQGTWNNAVQQDDLDILVRYGNQGNFAWNAYSTTGKAAGYRGNKEKPTEQTDSYEEDFQKNFSDADRQLIRDNQLGLTGERISDGKPIRTVNWEDQVGGDLERIIGGSIAQKELTEQDKFKGLGLDMKTETIKKLNEARARERELDFYKGLPGFSEIFNMNATLSNSILGDSGVGGILGTMGVNTSSLSENFEDQIAEFTGVNFNSSAYNWQKWFNETLVKNIEEQSEVKGFGVTFDEKTGAVTIGDERTTVYQLEEDFKKNFIDNYVTPRFDQSKSMDEFISYIETIDKETDQNIFQTQTAVNALRDIASLRAENFYASLEGKVGDGYTKYFDAEFYFNPSDSAKYGTVNEAKQAAYDAQKKGIEEDWAKAKANGNSDAYQMTAQEAKALGLQDGRTSVTWNELAYYYGLDLNDKTSFAKLHYDVIGKSRNYDPARDVVTDSDVKSFINNNVLSAVDNARNEFGDSPFLDFVTPEEFADAILEGIDPLENKEEWKELLEMYGLDDSFDISEVRDYILESVRTGAAKEIREGIKYLNQKSKKPTQKDLGITYIERDEDAKPEDDPDADSLYKTFKNAGFGGTQEEFYETFMPDMDRTDLEMIEQGLSGLQFKDADFSDPFTALGALQDFSGEGEDIFGNETKDNKEEDKDKESSYFDLFGDEREDDYASDKGREIITDFTSFFK
jgi:hypothetical protein